MIITKNNVCAPIGFTALGKSAGIKTSKELDLAIIRSESMCSAAAVFTKNKIKGAPLIVTKNHLKDSKAQAINITSGIANVCTGSKGIKDSESIAKATALELGLKKEDVLVSSTGLIGAFLPMNRILKSIKGIKSEFSKNNKVANAIMTTDLQVKEIAVKGSNFAIGAIAKGSGMIHPNMATMLCFITTDALISSKDLQNHLNIAVENSFNMISVDGDTSTSDMIVLMANGLANKPDANEFQEALNFVCDNLAKKIAKDGEGATKLIEVQVINANTDSDAKNVAKSIISSNLVKCAVFGNDPNWGRILCAIGNSDALIDPNKIDIYFEDMKIVNKGVSTDFNRKDAKKIMGKNELLIKIDLNQKNGLIEICLIEWLILADFIAMNVSEVGYYTFGSSDRAKNGD